VAGIKAFMADFDEVRCGTMGSFVELVKQQTNYVARAVGEELTEGALAQVLRLAARYEEKVKAPRIYSAVYFWGEKRYAALPKEKVAYFEWKRRCHVTQNPDLSYDPCIHLSEGDLLRRVEMFSC
jgi:hypothetical protein